MLRTLPPINLAVKNRLSDVKPVKKRTDEFAHSSNNVYIMSVRANTDTHDPVNI